MLKTICSILAFFLLPAAYGQYSYQIALLKYDGGGNWYVAPTALPNLIKFCNENLRTHINPQPATVAPGSPDIFNYPFVHATGNGNFYLTPEDAQNLRRYLIAGGFLNINDSYGMDKSVRRELKKIFPDKKLVQLPNTFPIYHQKYDFPNGLPKIHKHDGKAAIGYGIFYKGRLVIYYDYDSDIGDGWEDTAVHHDPVSKHIEALKMGADLLQYVFGGAKSVSQPEDHTATGQ